MCFQSCVSSCGSLILLDGAGASHNVSIFLGSLSFSRKGHLLNFLVIDFSMTSVSRTRLAILPIVEQRVSALRDNYISFMLALEFLLIIMIQSLVAFLHVLRQLVFL